MNMQFGSGVLFGIPNAGNTTANPTPYQLPILQEVSVEFKGDLKKLYGQNQFPVAKARGKIDVSIKGKIAAYDPNIFAQLYFGQPTTTGVARPIFNESHTPAASVSTTQITASVDLGVVNGDTGENMVRVTGVPTVGQYKFTPYNAVGPVDAAYTFNAGETASKVLLSYTYPDTAGVSLTINNQLMGFAPELQLLLYGNFRGKLFSLQLNSVVLGQISIPTKQEDFWVADFDGDASADTAGVVAIIQADL